MDNQSSPIYPIYTQLTEIFKIVGHEQSEAEAFANTLLLKVTQTSIAELIIQADNTDELTQAYKKAGSNIETIAEFIQTHWTEEEFSQVLEVILADTLSAYFEEIGPSLTPEQKQKIITLTNQE